MHKNLVELNKAINAGAVSENITENERQRKEAPCQLPLNGVWMSQNSLPLSQECKVQLVTLTLLLPVSTKRGQSL